MTSSLSPLVKNFSQELIDTVPEFQEFIEAKKALESDSTANTLWLTKEELRQTIEMLKTQGLPVSADQEEQFSRSLNKVSDTPVIMRYVKAKNSARKISGQIGTELLHVIGADFSPRKGC